MREVGVEGFRFGVYGFLAWGLGPGPKLCDISRIAQRIWRSLRTYSRVIRTPPPPPPRIPKKTRLRVTIVQPSCL